MYYTVDTKPTEISSDARLKRNKTSFGQREVMYVMIYKGRYIKYLIRSDKLHEHLLIR